MKTSISRLHPGGRHGRAELRKPREVRPTLPLRHHRDPDDQPDLVAGPAVLGSARDQLLRPPAQRGGGGGPGAARLVSPHFPADGAGPRHPPRGDPATGAPPPGGPQAPHRRPPPRPAHRPPLRQRRGAPRPHPRRARRRGHQPGRDQEAGAELAGGSFQDVEGPLVRDNRDSRDSIDSRDMNKGADTGFFLSLESLESLESLLSLYGFLDLTDF